MSTLVTRAGKGSPLTHNEVDANFTNLNTDKIQSGNTVAALTITALTTPSVQASGSGGLALKNSAGTTQISMGAGGGDNVTVAAPIAITPANGLVNIAPTGTGSLTINPATAGTMNNMAIGGTTAAAGSFTNLSVTGTTSFDGSEGTAGQVLTSAGTGATPTWSNVSASTATNLAGGALGSVPYQLLSGTTTFLAGNTTTTPQFITSTGVAGVATAPTYTGSTGSGNVVLATSPTLTTPVINGFTGNTSIVNIGSGQFYKDASGNVGIGTSSPASKLEVKSTNAITDARGMVAINSTNTAATNLGGSLSFGGETGQATTPYVFGSVAGRYEGSNYAGYLQLNTTSSAGVVTERMRIDSNGNLLFNSGYGSVATAYGCRAWVNFNGTGTVAIRASGNVSSITDNGTGDYTVNFTTAMPDVNYSTVTTSGADSAHLITAGGGTYSTSAVRLTVRVGVGSGTAFEDDSIVNLAIFR